MSAAPQFAGNDRTEELLARIGEIAVLPHVVYKVLELSGSDDTSAIEIERAIQIDPGFASRVLTLANSAHFALPKKVSSIKDAIMFCGLKTVRELAMTVGAYDLFMGKQDKSSMRRRTWWRHSLDTAVCCKWLAARTRSVPIEEAYTCGLLHLIGKILLDRFGGEDYEEVDRLIEGGYNIPDAESIVFGTNHVMIAIAATQKWGFPHVLSNGINYISEPSDTEPARNHRCCLAIASPIAWFAMLGRQGGQQQELSLPLWATSSVGISAEQHLELITGAIHAIGNAASIHG